MSKIIRITNDTDATNSDYQGTLKRGSIFKLFFYREVGNHIYCQIGNGVSQRYKILNTDYEFLTDDEVKLYELMNE